MQKLQHLTFCRLQQYNHCRHCNLDFWLQTVQWAWHFKTATMDNKVNAPDQDRRLDVQKNAAAILEAFNVHMEMVNKPDKNTKTEKENKITDILKKVKH